MRRIAKLSAALLLSLLLLLPALLLGSGTGARLALRLAEARLPVTSEGVSGSLWQGLAFETFSYVDDQLQLRAEQLALVLDWRCAIRGTLCVSELTARSLSIALPVKEGGGELPETLPLASLPRIQIKSMFVAELAFTRGDNTQFLRRLELAGQLGPRRIRLDRFAVEHESGSASASALLRRSGDWALDAELTLDEGVSPGAALVLPRALKLKASGDLRHLVAKLESSAAPALMLDIEASLAGAADVLTAEGSLSGLDGLLPVLAAQPWTQLDGPLRFSATADERGQRLDLEQMLAGYAQESLPLTVKLQRQDGVLTLSQSRLGPESRPLLRAIGELGSVAALEPRLQLVLLDFVPPAEAMLPVQAVTGALSLGFSLDAPLNSWSLASKRLLLAEQENHWDLALDLRADGDTLFPLGAVRGERNDQPFSYARGTEKSAPALLTVPEGLQLGDYTLKDLSVAIMPGEPLAATLKVSGDLKTSLDLTLKRTAAGADLRLQAFDLRLLDETVISENVIAGRWDQDGKRLFLDDFCLRWKRNLACSEAVVLGDSGSAMLALRVDEAYSGEVAEKPFALRARGEGTLAVAWSPEGVESAGLTLDLSELSLDPYVGSGTAPPIRWEQTRALGRWSPVDRSLALDLESGTLGGASLILNERDGALDGALTIDSLNLGALNDLMPEWTLAKGRLSSDLRIAGDLAEPALFGDLEIDQLTGRLPGMDTPLTDARLTLDAQGRRLAVRGTAELGGAPLTLEGLCCDDGAFDAQLRGERNRVVLPVGLDATVTPALDIRLDTESLTLGGLITVHEGVFVHSGPLNGGVALSDDVYRVDLPPAPRRRFALNAQLRTIIEPGFSLRSKELLATLSGDLRLDLRPEQPSALFGNLQVLGGELRALGQSLRLTEGVVAFVGDPLNPELNLSAEREIRAENLRVGFRVRGSLEEPGLELFSEPQRSERDMLSYLLRGRGPDVGAGADSAAMALSLGASAINQSGLLSSLNDIPGLSGVTLGAEGSDEDMAATISAYVGERLYLSYGLGIYEPVNALTARLYLRSRLWVEVVSRLESSLDLYYRFDRN